MSDDSYFYLFHALPVFFVEYYHKLCKALFTYDVIKKIQRKLKMFDRIWKSTSK